MATTTRYPKVKVEHHGLKGRAYLNFVDENDEAIIRVCIDGKQAETTNDALREILGPLPKPARRSVTFDNGSKFALHASLNAELATQTYFCDPHSPWQRGTIENTNGLLRRDMPILPPGSANGRRNMRDWSRGSRRTSKRRSLSTGCRASTTSI